MNRRDFFKRLSAVPIAAALAPALLDELLPTRSIFLPPRGGWTCHTDWTDYNISEFQRIVRQAFVPRMLEQIYETSPIIQLIERRMNEAADNAKVYLLENEAHLLFEENAVGLARILR